MPQEYPIDNTKLWSSIKLNKSGPMTSMYYGLGSCSGGGDEPETKTCSTPLIVFGNPNIPSSVIKSPPNAIKKIVGGKNHTCILHSWNGVSGSVSCYGFIERFKPQGSDYCLGTSDVSQYDDSGIQTHFTESYKDIDSSDDHVCAVTTSGYVRCYGEGDGTNCNRGYDNDYGQSIPPTGNTFTKVATGKYHTCALSSTSDAVTCWGAGQISDGYIWPHYGQSSFFSDGKYSLVSGDYHTCSIFNGQITCIGKNTHTQTDITGNSVSASTSNFIDTGSNHSCFVSGTNYNTIICSGSNFYNETSKTTSDSIHSHLVTTNEQIKKIVCGNNTNCILYGFYDNQKLETNYKVFCWGKNEEKINLPNIRYSDVWAFSDYIIALQNSINCEPPLEKQCQEYIINSLHPSVKVSVTHYPCAGRDCCVPLNNLETSLGDIDCLSQIPITLSQETGEKECVWEWVGGDTIPNFPNEKVKSIQLSSLRLGDREQIFKVESSCSIVLPKIAPGLCSLDKIQTKYISIGTLRIYLSDNNNGVINLFNEQIDLYETLDDLNNQVNRITQLTNVSEGVQHNIGYFKLNPYYDDRIISMVGGAISVVKPGEGGVQCFEPPQINLDLRTNIGAKMTITPRLCTGSIPYSKRSSCRLITAGEKGFGGNYECVGDNISMPETGLKTYDAQAYEIQNVSAGWLHYIMQGKDYTTASPGYGSKGLMYGYGAGSKTNCSGWYGCLPSGSLLQQQCGCEVEDDLDYRTTCGKTCKKPTAYGCLNNIGQAYVPNNLKKLSPDQTTILSSTYGISCGGSHSCAIVDYFSYSKCIACWGSNTHKQSSGENIIQVVDGPNKNSGIQERHPQYDINNNLLYYANTFWLHTNSFLEVSASMQHTCAIKSDRTVECWGDNQYGQCSIPSNATNCTQISCSSNTTCVIKNGNTLQCWGAENITLPNIKFIGKSRNNFGDNYCYIRTDGTLFCDGVDANMNVISVPLTNKKYKSASCGKHICCGLTESGDIDCFGEELYNVKTSKLPPEFQYEKIDVSEKFAVGLTSCQAATAPPTPLVVLEKLKLVYERYESQTSSCIANYEEPTIAKRYNKINFQNFPINLYNDITPIDDIVGANDTISPITSYWDNLCGELGDSEPFTVYNHTHYIFTNVNLDQSIWQDESIPLCISDCNICDTFGNKAMLATRYITSWLNGNQFGKKTPSNQSIYTPITASLNTTFQFANNSAPNKFKITVYYFEDEELVNFSEAGVITLYPQSTEIYSKLDIGESSCSNPEIIYTGTTKSLKYSDILNEMNSKGFAFNANTSLLLKIEVSPFGWYEESLKHIIYNSEIDTKSEYTISVNEALSLNFGIPQDRICTTAECDCNCKKDLTFDGGLGDVRVYSVYIPCNEYGQAYENCL